MFGLDDFDEVFEHAVDEVFVPDAYVAVGHEVVFEGAQFDAVLVGGVGDGDAGEIGEAGEGAYGGEFFGVGDDFDVACGGVGVFVGEAFEDSGVDGVGVFEGDGAVVGLELVFGVDFIVHGRCTLLYRFRRPSRR